MAPRRETDHLTEAQQAIRANAASVLEAAEFLQQSVDEARETGTSWAAIGRAMPTPVSRQAAWERFAQRVESEAS